MVNNSPWPLTTSLSLWSLIIGFVLAINNQGNNTIIIISMINIVYSVYKWLREVIIEGTYKGEHTKKVQENIRIGFLLFIVSEVVIFATLFYCLFFNKIIPSVETNNTLIGPGIEVIKYESIPLFNTCLLFFGSLTCTGAQYYIIVKNKSKVIELLIITIILNVIFSFLQFFEYFYSPFTLTDSFYGSIFFFLTGCHALHVIVGTLLIVAALARVNHYSNNHHMLSSLANYYAHMVDNVWLVLYAILYVYLS